MKPFRILNVFPGAGVGGVTTGLLGILRHLDQTQYQTTVVASNQSPAVKLFRKCGISCFVLPMKHRVEYLKRLIQQEGIQLVQSCDSATEGARAAYQMGVPHAWYIAGKLEATFSGLSRQSLEIFQAMIDHLSHAVVVPSKALAREVFPNLPPAKLHIIPWGVEINSQTRVHSRGWLKKQLRIPERAPLIAMVGNFYPAKRHFDFLRAAALIHRALPRARFLIAGNCIGNSRSTSQASTRYHARVIDQIERLSLHQAITIAHFSTTERDAWYSEFDLLLVSSYDSMSQALLEAGACGVPLVAADTGGNPEVIQNGRSGLLVPYRGYREMAQAALQILRNPNLAKRLGQAARKRILSKFTVAQQAKRFEHFYRILIAHGHRTEKNGSRKESDEDNK